jgi:eukaryotic-like serine/threonine-protein kinase
MTSFSKSGSGRSLGASWGFAGSPDWRDCVPLPSLGERLGDFELVEEIGEGGAGVVYKALRSGSPDRFAAVKVIHPALLMDRSVVRRFKREGRCLKLLRHANVVRFYYADLDAPIPYLATEWVPGTDLRKLVERDGPIEARVALYYAIQAARGLQHAHTRALIHRDIKPANIIVTPEGVVKVLDFGLVSTIDPTDTRFPVEVHNLTRQTSFVGTLNFISPEQGRNPRAADARSDVYSLGCTLYYMLTAKVPFVACSTVDMICRKATEQPPVPSAVRPSIPCELDDLLVRMMACDPAHRPESMTEVIRVLVQTMSRMSARQSASM